MRSKAGVRAEVRSQRPAAAGKLRTRVFVKVRTRKPLAGDVGRQRR